MTTPTPPGSARPAMSAKRLAELRDTPRVLRRISAELEKVDWPGGSNGQSWLEDAADEYDEMLAEIDRLRASARGETTAEGAVCPECSWPGPHHALDKSACGHCGHSWSTYHSRDAAIGAALRAALDLIPDGTDGLRLSQYWNSTMPNAARRWVANVESENGDICDTGYEMDEATDRLASQLRAVSTGKGT